jgi:DmsE family decaheme c-type cytochrome
MKLMRQVLTMCAFVGAAVGVSSSMAADIPKPAAAKEAPKVVVAKVAPEEAPKDLVLKGDAKCTACHDEADAPGLLAIGKTKHGTVADSRTPTCTKCHGESEEHVLNAQDTKVRPKPGRIFSGQLAPGSIPTADRVEHYFGIQGKRTDSPVEERNDACLECHEKDPKRSHWEGSTHQARDVACSSCHKIHSPKDVVRDKRTQTELCFTCHKEQRSQVNKPSHHPILEGKMACSDCHNVHGSVGPKLMKRDSVVDTCYTCHMEKRGPFVRNHEPVNDDCSNCHNPHGTTAESMLKSRPPFLCNSCHTPHAPVQPVLRGQVPAPGVTGWWNGTDITQGRGCLNCHTQVHGSNNPSAASPNPQRGFR